MQNKLVLKDYSMGQTYFVFLSKKAEKITAAIYLISNLFSENEPIKWSLRQEGLLLLKLTTSLMGLTISDKVLFSNLRTLLVEIKSLLQVGFISGLISEMNFSILESEITKLLTGMGQNQTIKDLSDTNIRQKFFDTGHSELHLKDHDSNSFHKGQNKRQTIKDRISYKDVLNNIKQGKSADYLLTHQRQTILKKNSRQEAIIEFLGQKSDATIKDFYTVISGCSEKTIQRELLDLVSKGVLKKQGERRWSKYSLKNTI